MLHPDTELRLVSEEIGYGVFVTRPIPKGTITWALDPLDQVFDERRVEILGAQLWDTLTRYTWIDAAGDRILCWDLARYMNHNCEANSLSPGGMDFEIAVRDIAAGDELTSDYGTLNIEQPLSCGCGSSSCRGVVKPGDFEELTSVWDTLVQGAFSSVVGVDQPLWAWIEKYEKTIQRLALRPETVPSILKHRWYPTHLKIAAAGRRTQPRNGR